MREFGLSQGGSRKCRHWLAMAGVMWCVIIAGTCSPRAEYKGQAKVECRTPTGRRPPTRIFKWKFDRIQKAILDELQVDGIDIEYSELARRVEAKIPKEEAARIGRIPWFVEVVALELEVRGELERVVSSSANGRRIRWMGEYPAPSSGAPVAEDREQLPYDGER